MTELQPKGDAPLTSSSAEKPVTQEPKKLFKYYMDRNIQEQQEQLHFFNRTNRWRYNTDIKMHMTKWYKIKYPAMAAVGLIVAIDWIYGWDRTEPTMDH